MKITEKGDKMTLLTRSQIVPESFLVYCPAKGGSADKLLSGSELGLT